MRLARTAGLGLAASDQEATDSRRNAAGALLGYGAGLGIGAAYGVVEASVPDLPTPISGFLLGAAAMVASDLPATLTGATDPRTWPRSGWLADLVPHLAFGVATVMVYRALRSA
jgi:hypothetical protein